MVEIMSVLALTLPDISEIPVLVSTLPDIVEIRPH